MILKILYLAVLTESIVEVAKWAIEGQINRWRVIALILGVVLAPMAGIDLFAAIGIPLVVPWVGQIGATIGTGFGWLLTGVLICRGSGLVNVLLDTLGRMKDVLSKIPGLPGGQG
jgi:hypothetical protein